MNSMYVMTIVTFNPRLNFSALQAKWVCYGFIAIPEVATQGKGRLRTLFSRTQDK